MIKCLIDRPTPSKDEIENRQNFEQILNKTLKKNTFSSPWFYGAIGFSSMLVIIFLIY